MQVYTKVVYDIETLEIIEEEHYLYEGEVCKCDGGGSDYPSPSQQELDLYEAQKQAIDLAIQKQSDPTLLAAERATYQYTLNELEDYNATRDQRNALNQKALDLYSQQLSATERLLGDLKTTSQLASLGGGLSDQEQGYIDSIAQSSIKQLTSAVADDFTDIVQGDIAKMAAKGILNSNIATNAIAELTERAQKTISSGTVDIENQRMASILAIQEANKARGMQQQQLELQKWQLAMGGGSGGGQAGIQPITAALNTSSNLGSRSQSAMQSIMSGSNSLAGMYSQERAARFQADQSNAQIKGSNNAAAAGIVTAAAAAAAA